MPTSQQQEALDYFRSHAADWRSKADGTNKTAVNIIDQRNQYVVDVARERKHTAKALDVGCGTGELVCQLAVDGIDALGVDYAPEMIDLSIKKAKDDGISGASFKVASIFDMPAEANSYDLISANGFIEYISLGELKEFLQWVSVSLRPGGSFVVGSRNRLFNLVSMNEFTSNEIASGAVESLLKEAVSWNAARTLDEAKGVNPAPMQAADSRHPKRGVTVGTRFQYTPIQLIDLVKEYKLQARELCPIHVHGVTPAFGSSHAELHTSIANMLQLSAKGNLQLLPNASSFMLHAVKA